MPVSWNNKFFTLLFCAAIHLSVAGQKTDSLINVLKSTTQDTSRVSLMISISRQYLQAGHLSEGKNWAEQSLALAEKINNPQSIRNAKNAVGNYYHRQGNFYHGQNNLASALENYFIALKIFEKLGDKQRMGLLLGNIGLVYWTKGDYSEALKFQDKALNLFREINDQEKIAGTYNNIGLVYENQGDYQQALKNYFDAIKIYEKLGYKQALIDRYFNIGFLYEDQGNYEQAKKYHLAALKIGEELNNKTAIAASYTNLGEVYFHEGEKESHLEKKQKLFADAYDNQIMALKIQEETGSTEGLYIVYNDLVAISLQLGNFSDAKKYSDLSLARAKESGDVNALKDSYQIKWQLDSATENWKQAFEEHKLFILYRDSLSNQESTRKIMRARMQYDFDKKEDSLRYRQALTSERLKQQILLAQEQQQQLLLKEKELELSNNAEQIQDLKLKSAQADIVVQKAAADKKQNQLLILNKENDLKSLQLKKQGQLKNYLLGGLGLFLVLSFFIYKNYRTRNQLRLQTLRNKIASDLHDDVGSTLSSISIFSQMAQQQSREVIPMLETIGESSRKMLDAMADIVWTINPENDQFEKIVLRMKSFAYELLGAKKIDFEFVADDAVAKINVSMEVRKNLYLIFKEATNNMAKYASADKAMFTIKEENKHLTMVISDNGKGFDLERSTEGNGLKNMRKRANEIGADLVIESFPGSGTIIQLSIAV